MAAPACGGGLKKSQKLLRFHIFSKPSCRVKCYCTDTNKLKKSVGKSLSKSPFWQNVRDRKDEASRSILVRLSGKTSEDSLLQYCTSHGKVQHYFTYSQLQQERYAVVEFKTPDGIDLILDRAQTPGTNGRIQSRFLSFSGSGQGGHRSTPSQYQQLNKDCSFAELYQDLATAQSVSDQLDILTSKLELRDPETRLRFLVSSLIEEAFQRILPDSSLHLFGSSVNSFGRRSCDMDMFLERNTAQGVVPMKKGKDQYKLGYDPSSAESERAAAQATLFTLASFLEKQVPHCMSVARILQAKCPLVKFRHHATGLSCDLTADNSIALKSSELLYVFSQLDPRVRPLVFVIRHWARHHGITNRVPGYWITNFPLTLLVVFFLQTRPQPVVPSFDYLRSLADESDSTIIDGTDCTIPGDLSKVEPSKNTQSTAELLQEFFTFCTTFDFESKSLSVRSGQSSPKPDRFSPLYMENPFQTQLNMCRNVSEGLLNEVQKHSHHALQMMDVPGFHGPGSGSEAIHPWGVGALLAPLKSKRNGKRSIWLNSSIGSVLKGLSQKAGQTGTDKQPRSNLKGSDSPVAFSHTLSNLKDTRETLEGSSHADARTGHVQHATAHDTSLKVDSLRTPQEDKQTWRVCQTKMIQLSNLAKDRPEATPHRENVIEEMDSAQSSSTLYPDTDNAQAEITGKTHIPKLRIAINSVRNRLFDGGYKKATKGIVH
ncbi:poly(A) RNA polymerase, mitochondrial-like [Acanthaster planci]|uniref:Poly(A) RNA polymerase, mitochondrial-like n=1 Tax=Acanthaster planci TaxID=133434 RepID=A0A8B7ZRU7_ACAPL|nr:poly(A) RNA polymerase, mitochondrial-like [Acanthaster planci]